jgi:hypothetical protein
VPAPPVARLLRITGPGRQIDIFSHRQLQRWAAGYREHRGLGQPGHQSRPREWTAARQMGPGGTPGLVGCPGLFPGPRPTRQSGLQAMFLWRGREGSLGVGCSRIARGRQGAAASR